MLGRTPARAARCTIASGRLSATRRRTPAPPYPYLVYLFVRQSTAKLGRREANRSRVSRNQRAGRRGLADGCEWVFSRVVSTDLRAAMKVRANTLQWPPLFSRRASSGRFP